VNICFGAFVLLMLVSRSFYTLDGFIKTPSDLKVVKRLGVMNDQMAVIWFKRPRGLRLRNGLWKSFYTGFYSNAWWMVRKTISPPCKLQPLRKL